jgi:O-antigen/teichoic acid export membrane protein
VKEFSLIVLKNSIWGLAAQVAVKFLSFAFSVLIIRRLGAETYGQYATVVAFGIAFSFLADLGLSAYSVREIARKRGVAESKAIEEIYSNVIVLRLILSTATIFLLTISARLTGRPWYMVGAIVLNSIGLLLYSLQGANESVLMGYERFDITSVAKIINQFIFVVLGAIVLFIGWGYYGLIGSNLLALSLMTLICWNGVRSLGLRIVKPAPKIWIDMVRMSLPFGLINLALGLSYKFDTILLNIYRGNAETGYYNAVYNLVFSAVVFSNVINTTLYPSLAIQATKSPENLPRIYSRVFRYLMAISLPIAVGTWAVASKLVPFLYTENYLPAVQAMQIIMWVVPLMYASEFLGYIVVIANQEKIVARSVIISTIINIALNLFLVPRFGFIAASIMTVITEAILVGHFMSAFIKPLLASLLMGLILIVFQGSFNLFEMIGVGLLTYILALMLFKVVVKDDFEFFIHLRSPAEHTLDS